MSSSSQPKSSAQQAPRDLFQSRDLRKYRQTVYHDGAGRHVAESCCRSRVDRNVKSAPTTGLDWTLYPVQNEPMPPKRRPVDTSPRKPSSESDSEMSGLAEHVTSAKRRSCAVRPKVVIIDEARQRCVSRINKTRILLQAPSDLTPPPTPRLRRLATPDLSDLDESPFCDCGVGSHVITLCTSCTKEFETCSV